MEAVSLNNGVEIDLRRHSRALVNLSLLRTEKGDGDGALDAIERAIRI